MDSRGFVFKDGAFKEEGVFFAEGEVEGSEGGVDAGGVWEMEGGFDVAGVSGLSDD